MFVCVCVFVWMCLCAVFVRNCRRPKKCKCLRSTSTHFLCSSQRILSVQFLLPFCCCKWALHNFAPPPKCSWLSAHRHTHNTKRTYSALLVNPPPAIRTLNARVRVCALDNWNPVLLYHIVALCVDWKVVGLWMVWGGGASMCTHVSGRVRGWITLSRTQSTIQIQNAIQTRHACTGWLWFVFFVGMRTLRTHTIYN